jgi:hypothetical protein
MGQQISMEDALTACREKLGEQAYENALLRARVSVLERRAAELETETAHLRNAPQPPAGSGPEAAPPPSFLAGDETAP